MGRGTPFRPPDHLEADKQASVSESVEEASVSDER